MKFIVYCTTHVVTVVPAIDPVALACARVPLGFHALSVSTLTIKLSVGPHVFQRCNVMLDTDVPFPMIFDDFFVLAETSPILGFAETIPPPSEYDGNVANASSI